MYTQYDATSVCIISLISEYVTAHDLTQRLYLRWKIIVLICVFQAHLWFTTSGNKYRTKFPRKKQYSDESVTSYICKSLHELLEIPVHFRLVWLNWFFRRTVCRNVLFWSRGAVHSTDYMYREKRST